MSCLITMSQKELHRLESIQKVRDRRLSVVQAAELLDLSRSQVHRLLQAYDCCGAAGLVSMKRSQPSNRRHSEDFRNAVLDLVRERNLDFGAVRRVHGAELDIRMTGRRPGDAVSIVADVNRAQKVLDWVPEHDNLDEIVESALAWEASLNARNQK